MEKEQERSAIVFHIICSVPNLTPQKQLKELNVRACVCVQGYDRGAKVQMTWLKFAAGRLQFPIQSDWNMSETPWGYHDKTILANMILKAVEARGNEFKKQEQQQ